MTHPMEAHRLETAVVRVRGAGADAREGVTAFLERRAAAFPGLPSAELPQFRRWWVGPPFEFDQPGSDA